MKPSAWHIKDKGGADFGIHSDLQHVRWYEERGYFITPLYPADQLESGYERGWREGMRKAELLCVALQEVSVKCHGPCATQRCIDAIEADAEKGPEQSEEPRANSPEDLGWKKA